MLTNLRAIQRRHEWLIRQNRHMFDRELGEQMPGVAAHVREHATFKHRTNVARDGVRTRLVRLKSGARMRITNVAKHAHYLEFGTRPHTITARAGGTLSFIAGGRRVFTKSVRHPGTRPYRFMANAAKHAHQSLHPELRHSMRRIAQRF